MLIFVCSYKLVIRIIFSLIVSVVLIIFLIFLIFLIFFIIYVHFAFFNPTIYFITICLKTIL